MNKLKSNFIYDGAYQILILIIPFITTPYIARVIGADGSGIYSYTYSIVSYFMMFALLGMNNYGNREVSKVKDDKEKLNHTFSSIYYLQLLVTICVLAIYLIYVFQFNSKYFSIELIQMIYIISVAFDINWLFCGLQEFKITVTRSAVTKIITLALIFLFVKSENDLINYILILAITTLFNQAILWTFLRKENIKFVKVNKKDIFKHLKPTLILFIPVIAVSVYKVMDKIMIGKIATVTEVGYYEYSEKMLNIILAVVSALGTVTLPQMTYLYSQKKFDEYNKIFNKSIEFIFFLVFPVIFGFLATADDLVFYYLGSEFSKSSILLKILSISLLFSPVASIVRMQLLIPRNKDKEYIISVILGAIINFALNWLLIIKLQSIGAAISTVIAEFIVCIMQLYYVRKDLNIKEWLNFISEFFITSLIMFIIVYVIKNIIEIRLLRLIIQICVGIIVYLILNYKYIITNIDVKKIFNIKSK